MSSLQPEIRFVNYGAYHLLERLRNRVVFICRQEHVLREVDFYAMTFSDCDRRRYLHKAIHNCGCRLGNRRRGAIGEDLGTGAAINTAPLRNLGSSGDHAESDGGAENLEVMVIYFVFQPLFADLIKTMKLVEINRITIRHD